MLIRLLLLLLAAAMMQAQVAPTASLTGTVLDPSGAAIPAADVRLINPETGFERKATAQSDGTYLFAQVPVGLYRVEAGAAGFSQFKQSGVRLNVNTSTTLNTVSYTHLRAHETRHDLVCRLL